MKLSKQTIEVLKNLATINSNLYVKEGSTLLTVSPNKSVMSQAVVSETFDQEFGIFNLSEFLGVYALFKDPELEFSEKFLTVKEGKNKVRYAFADSTLLTFPQKAVKMPECEVEFTLGEEDLAQIVKASGVISAPDIEFRGDGSTIKVVLQDVSNEYSNQLTVDLDAETDQEFSVFVKIDNLKVLPASYNVSISSKKIIELKNTANDQTYWVAAEANSEFK